LVKHNTTRHNQNKSIRNGAIGNDTKMISRFASKPLLRVNNTKLGASFASDCLSTRSPKDKLEYEYVIIGGGPVGASIGYHLAQVTDPKKILVIEKDFCYKKTSAMLSAGGIRQQFSLPENILISKYGAEFIKNKENFKVAHDEYVDVQFHENGYLFLAGERSRDVLVTNHNTQHQCGATWIDLLELDRLKKQFPWLNVDGINLGTFGRSNEGYFDPWMFVNGLKKRSIAMGVDYIEGDVQGAQLEKISTGSTSYKIESIDFYANDKSNAAPQRYKVYGQHFVNAAGAWSGRLLEKFAKSLPLGMKGIMGIPVAPRKRCIFGVHCREAHPNYPIPPSNTPLVVDPTGVYFRAEAQPGKFIMGVSPSEADDVDVPEDQEESALQSADMHLFEEIVWPKLAERVPAFEQLKVTSSWAGFYDYNRLDQNAIIGPHSEVRNFLLCTGFSGHGLQQSPAVGRAVSELLTNNGKFKSIDLSRFSFERVVDNKPIFETGIV
jgi:FAD-dependent oxidoreductase domain-containing protein 1